MISCRLGEMEMLVNRNYRRAMIALAACSMCGCNNAPPNSSRWEKSQRESPSIPADRRSDKVETSDKYDRDVSAEPPPWNPGGSKTGTKVEPKTNWKVGDKPRASSEPTKPQAPNINLEDLKTGDILPGSEFNKFFPRQEGEWDIVYKQEKEGFALASLRRGGEELALLSITDLRSNPEAAEKYLQASGETQGYPTAEIGSKGLGALVGARFQVQVRSAVDSFTARDRSDWIRKFDLEGLERLK